MTVVSNKDVHIYQAQIYRNYTYPYTFSIQKLALGTFQQLAIKFNDTFLLCGWTYTANENMLLPTNQHFMTVLCIKNIFHVATIALSCWLSYFHFPIRLSIPISSSALTNIHIIIPTPCTNASTPTTTRMNKE